MLIWLASYPRSGNTFVRIVLSDIFGLKTQSLSGDGDNRVFSARPNIIETVGHLRNSKRGLDLINEARNSEEMFVVKTHESPLTDDPCIYVVRDGRSALISYYHYLREVENLPTPIEAVIEGKVYAGSWSEHIASWDPLNRLKALLLRYEDITLNPDELIRRVADFCSITPGLRITRPFGELHTMYPEFFRSGSDEANIREMTPHLKRFIELHGPMMTKLGYFGAPHSPD